MAPPRLLLNIHLYRLSMKIWQDFMNSFRIFMESEHPSTWSRDAWNIPLDCMVSSVNYHINDHQSRAIPNLPISTPRPRKYVLIHGAGRSPVLVDSSIRGFALTMADPRYRNGYEITVDWQHKPSDEMGFHFVKRDFFHLMRSLRDEDEDEEYTEEEVSQAIGQLGDFFCTMAISSTSPSQPTTYDIPDNNNETAFYSPSTFNSADEIFWSNPSGGIYNHPRKVWVPVPVAVNSFDGVAHPLNLSLRPPPVPFKHILSGTRPAQYVATPPEVYWSRRESQPSTVAEYSYF